MAGTGIPVTGARAAHLDDDLLRVWQQQLLGLNLERFEPDSEQTAFFRNSPQFLTSLYPEVNLERFLPDNYGGYMLNQPTGLLNRWQWRMKLRLFAQCTEWISLGLPGASWFSRMGEDADLRLKQVLRASGPTPRKTYHAAARIRINLLSLFHYCEWLGSHTGEIRARDSHDIETIVVDLYNRWLPLYEQLLAGDLLTMSYRELDTLSRDVIRLNDRVITR